MRSKLRRRIRRYDLEDLRTLERERKCHPRGAFVGPVPFIYRNSQPNQLQMGTPGTAATGTTSLSVPFPASTQFFKGSLLLLVIVNKYPTNGPSTPSGWTFAAQQSGGAGSAGDDSGNVYTTVYYKTAAGTETGNVSVTLTGSTLALGRIFCVNGQSSGLWIFNTNFSSFQGSDNTGGSSVSIVTSAAAVPLGGNIVLGFCGFNTDGPTYSSISLQLSSGGAVTSFATATIDNNSSSPFLQLLTTYWYVTKVPTGSGAMTFGATASISDPTRFPAGSGIFILIQPM